jgi:hypothetical protein
MRIREDWLPRPAQELLLHAALAETPEDATREWSRWRSEVELTDVDSASFQILPLAYRNLTRLGIEDADRKRLRGVYLLSWSSNQLLVQTGAVGLRKLADAGIDTIVLKGAAVANDHYKDLGVRSMFDFDILVPHDRAGDAMDVLEETFTPAPAEIPPREWIPERHSVGFSGPEGRDIDLHWYSLWFSSPEEDLWPSSRVTTIGGVATRTLSPTDQLLHVLAHGAWWMEPARLRWVADSVTVIRSGGDEIDWARFAERARERRLGSILMAPLTYLRERFGVEIPSETLGELRRERPTLLERGAHRAARAPRTPARALVMHYERYRRMKRMDPDSPQPPNFPSTFRNLNGCETYLDLLKHGGRRLVGNRRAFRAQEALR